MKKPKSLIKFKHSIVLNLASACLTASAVLAVWAAVAVPAIVAASLPANVVFAMTADDESTIASNAESEATLFTQNADCYETKLTLKKGAATVYTGQQDVVVATPMFRAKTTCRTLNEDSLTVTDAKGNAAAGITAKVVNGTVRVSVNKEAEADTDHPAAAAGTYTLTVEASAPEGTTGAKASLKFKVAQGIEKITVKTPSVRIYKKQGKAASLKVTTTLNDGLTAAKVKKVTYAITDVNGNPLDQTSALYGMISINKNKGTVTVNKKLTIEDERAGAGDYSFYVTALAADYQGNTTSAISDEIVVTNEALTLTQVVIAQLSGDGYKVIAAQNGAKLTYEDLANDTFLLGITDKVGTVTVGDVIDDDKAYLASACVTYTGNKVMSVGFDGQIKPSRKTANNVTLSVKTNDGSNITRKIKISLVSKTAEDYCLLFYQKDGANQPGCINGDGETTPSLTGSFYDINTSVVFADFGVKEKEWSYALTDFYNQTVTVKSGGKLVGSDNNTYTILATAKTVKVQLKVNGRTKVYELTNNGFSTKKAPTLKAGSLVANSVKAQSVTVTISNLNGFALTKDTVVCVAPDYTKTNDTKYGQFADALFGDSSTITVTTGEDGKGSFTLQFAADRAVAAETYKLNVAFGHMENGSFAADTKPATISIKVQAADTKDLTSAYKAVSAAAQTIASGVKVEGVAEFDHADALPDGITAASNEVLFTALKTALEAVQNKAREAIPSGSDVTVSMPQYTAETPEKEAVITVAEGDFILPVQNAAGKLIVKVTLADENGNTKTLDIPLTVEKVQSITELKTAIEAELANTDKIVFDNDTTDEQIMAAAESVRTNSTIQIAWVDQETAEGYTQVGSILKKEAAIGALGGIKGKLRLTYTNGSVGEAFVEIDEEFVRQCTGAEAQQLVAEAVSGDIIGEYILSLEDRSDKNIRVKILEKAKSAIEGQPYFVIYAYEGFSYTACSYNREGSISYTLQITADTSQGGDSSTITNGGEISVTDAVIPIDRSKQTLARAATDIQTALWRSTFLNQVSNNSTEEELTALIETLLVPGDYQEDRSVPIQNEKIVAKEISVEINQAAGIDVYVADISVELMMSDDTAEEPATATATRRINLALGSIPVGSYVYNCIHYYTTNFDELCTHMAEANKSGEMDHYTSWAWESE